MDVNVGLWTPAASEAQWFVPDIRIPVAVVDLAIVSPFTALVVARPLAAQSHHLLFFLRTCLFFALNNQSLSYVVQEKGSPVEIYGEANGFR
jgi:hypothetical protein